jgi:hypothetical protein
LERLRPRGFGKKRSLALREFALGMRHCSGLWSASLHAEYTNALLLIWRWSASLQTRGSKCSLAISVQHWETATLAEWKSDV